MASLLLVVACGDSGNGNARKADGESETPFVLVAFGDSLTAGYGLPDEETFPAQLEAALKARGHNVRVINAGVSGDTTASGLARLDWSVGPEAQAVIVALGANDMLRGVPPAETRKNLDEILTRLEARKLPVLLAGMRAIPGMGGIFGHEFDTIYKEMAKKHGVLFYPFFLNDVALRGALNQNDNMHPNAQGVAVIVRNILPDVEKLVRN